MWHQMRQQLTRRFTVVAPDFARIRLQAGSRRMARRLAIAQPQSSPVRFVLDIVRTTVNDGRRLDVQWASG
jgi:hypothetical protein